MKMGYLNGESSIIALDDEVKEAIFHFHDFFHLLVVVAELMPLSVAELDESHEEYEEEGAKDGAGVLPLGRHELKFCLIH